MKKLVALFGIALALTAALWSSAQSSGYKVIVHSENPSTTLSAKDVSNYFRKKATRWSLGEFKAPVAPIDLEPGSAIRQAFTKEVHGKSVSSIERYWQNEIFSGGKTPPPKAPSDAQVISHVATTPGAIGYVSAGTQLSANVKEVTISG